ncbi:uncharacterized protein LOC115374264 isoform X2 [Myripristis murdjan]|uniref:uncharacterized protein LOC115374264 isoform X1 n=1 Tax=Myripristis murdjan TaxID=586833 RepID=UPI001175E456|nr:uncharacterized protein LOC115374264 isoform X1 [Myripristis murdjan]XP_029928974.1 uncharacterized protein LOC115374264 isoform X2 [Myripristis murdjan]
MRRTICFWRNLCTVLLLALTGLNSQSSVLAASGPDDILITRFTEVIAGFSTTLTCSSSNCVPQCTYSWSFEGRQVDGSPLIWTPDGQKSVVDVKCTAKNTETGKTYFKSVKVEIDPWHISISGPDNVAEGKETTFTCLTNCPISDCTVSWQFRSGSPSGHYSTNGNVLRWTPSTPGKSHNLTCVAKNKANGHTAEANKKVYITESHSYSGSALDAGAIAGITIACLIVVGGVVGGVVYYMYKKGKLMNNQSSNTSARPADYL